MSRAFPRLRRTDALRAQIEAYREPVRTRLSAEASLLIRMGFAAEELRLCVSNDPCIPPAVMPRSRKAE